MSWMSGTTTVSPIFFDGIADVTPPKSHCWEPIADLPNEWPDLVDPEVPAYVQTWLEQAKELREKDSYQTFLKKLRRQFAIETGAIENVYRISESGTRTLLAKGLDSALLSHDDTDEPPALVVSRIKDQYAAIDGLYEYVSSQRGLTNSYIRELHQILTAHQDTYDARDTLGRDVKRDLPRGVWKKLPNNVEGPDDFVFEFCPPEQVESEMDRLLKLHETHVAEDVTPLVEAAWFHHRFALIHPFTDGNGRVARCLATLVLLKNNWFPLVVTRADKLDYLGALRQADSGELRPLVGLFGNLQRKVIREALSIAEDTLREASKIQGIIASVKTTLERRREEKNDQIAGSFDVADTLQFAAKSRLEEMGKEITKALQSVNTEFEAFDLGAVRGDEKKAHYYYRQIVRCATKLDYFANLHEYRSWAALALITDVRTEILFSFHAIGRGRSGVMGCTAMAYTKNIDEDGKTVIDDVTPLTREPFEFTYPEDPANVRQRFDRWIEDCLVSGLDRWKNEIG